QFPELKIPHLAQLGIFHAAHGSTGKTLPNANLNVKPAGSYGHAIERSRGKDTPSGHWEIAGVPVLFDWGYFNEQQPTFPSKLIADFIKETGVPGVLGLKHASGTDIINELGDEHCRTGKPIIYTSADSVFQIACHETTFGLERLYECCEIARRLVDDYNIGRVIARPFLGERGDYYRTGNRRDLATPPPAPTLLEQLVAQGGSTIAIGKIADIFAHQGITTTIHADGNMALFDATLDAMKTADNKSLIFTNFVDFDSKYGHRRNIAGYAKALEEFDARLPELQAQLQPGDLVIITADHGCDPTFPGSDHTREHIPVLAFGPNIPAKNLGARSSFADIGQSIATHLGIKPLANGESFL
ncbi:MAG: phosphopentomutase, partial [Gammaproteobacteria bacterium]|nr:phosphopentomutase [Gammaproteobacteria bacterium]